MSRFVKELMVTLIGLFLEGLAMIGVATVIILPLILTFNTSGLIQQIARVVLIIEGVIGLGVVGEWIA